MTQPTQDTPNLLTTRIIWGALTVSQLVYLVVAFTTAEPPEEPPDQMLSVIFFVLGCSNIGLGAFGVDRFMPVTNASSFMTSNIIKWAVIESAVVFGLVNSFMGGPAVVIIGLYVLALLGMIKTFPKQLPVFPDSTEEEG